VIKEAKAKELNDKVVAEATVAVAATGDSTHYKFGEKLGIFILLHYRQLEVLLLLKMN
jgi:YidC/Oxa1 family membrane protein insertase